MPRREKGLILREWPLLLSLATAALFFILGGIELSSAARFTVALGWLFAAILVAAFAVVRHADALAERLGEPYGTLVLTLAMSGMEMMMIAAVLYGGSGGATLARDTMMAVLMIVLNGLVGACLLLGGLKYHEQTYNVYGANAFLAVLMPLAVLGLVLPSFSEATPGPVASPLHAAFLCVMSVGLYAVFLGVQTGRHREYFVAPGAQVPRTEARGGGSTAWHVILLLLYALPIVYLAKQIAAPIGYLTSALGAPGALSGVLVAVLVLAPEGLAAVRAAQANQLQRSINLALGTALSSISLTIPAVLAIGFFAGKTIVLGLDPAPIVLLVLTFLVSLLTFALERTHVLLGAVHLLLFLAYLMLIFER